MIIRLNGESFAGRPAIVNSPRAALDREYVVLSFGLEGTLSVSKSPWIGPTATG
jgi:hypothetical protein